MFFFEHHGLGTQLSFSQTILVNQNFPLHFHRAAELVWVEEGSISLSIENTEYEMQRGRGALIFPSQMHEIKAAEHSRLKILIFSPELIGDFFTEYNGQVPSQPLFSSPTFFSFEDAASVYTQKSFLYGICDQLVTRTAFRPANFLPKTKIIQQLIAYVDHHYRENMTLKTAAISIKYDYGYLSKLFKQVTQCSFSEYLNQYRISQVCYQLRSTHKDISEIALDCGYQNLRTFHRNFHRFVGCTPGDYRQKYFIV